MLGGGRVYSDMFGKGKVPLPGTFGGIAYGMCEGFQSKKCEDRFEEDMNGCEKLKPAKP